MSAEIEVIDFAKQTNMQSQMQREVFLLDGRTLTLPQLHRIVTHRLAIDLTPAAWALVEKSRNAIHDMMADSSRTVYGITTGFGSFANVSISPPQRQQLQLNLIRSHATGVGKPTPLATVKRMFILRINTLAKGRSGIQLDNLRKFIRAYNADFVPLVPQQGTVGASGDLAPLAHLALGLLGEGLAWDEKRGVFGDAGKVLEELGLTPLELKEKEGLALINGTQFMAAFLSSAAVEAERLLHSSVTLYSLAVELFGVDRSLFSPSSQQFYHPINPDLSAILQQIHSLLSDDPSTLHQLRAYQQQVSSLLDCPESLASVKRSLAFTWRLLEEEMNGATDNPLVYFKDDGFKEDQLISAGNFHGQYVAKAADFLGFALFQLGRFSEARIQRYVNGRISRLPPFLIKNGGLNSGFMIAQYTTAALLSESKQLTKPASSDSISTSAGQEDHVSMGGYACRKTHLLLHNISHIHAIELLLANTALALFEQTPSPRLAHLVQKVRQRIEPLLEDRFYGPDIAAAHALVMADLQSL